MLDLSEHFGLMLIFIVGFGLAALLAAPFSRWWQKHSKVALTWICMVLFTIVTGIVMLVLFFIPLHRKLQPRITDE